MQLTTTWVQISTVGTGALVQRHNGFVALAYAAVTPTTEDRFSLLQGDAVVHPVVAGKGLWAKASKGTASITVEELA